MKHAIVTGSTKGIGRAVAERLLDEGWFVTANYARDEEGATAFAAANAARSDRISVVRCDLSSREGADVFLSRVASKIPSVDALVLNAGTTDRTPFGQISWDEWTRVLNTNLTVPFFLAQGLADRMAEGGSILLVGSVCGRFPHARSPAYGVSKAGVHQLAKELVKFFADRRVTVNAIAPGFAETPWQAGKDPEHKRRIVGKIAAGRFAEPSEIADFCWSVLNNHFVNGAVLSIDGGYCYQ